MKLQAAFKTDRLGQILGGCILALLPWFSLHAQEQTQDNQSQTALEICLSRLVLDASPETTVEELHERCRRIAEDGDIRFALEDREFGPMALREAVESASSNTPFIMSGHRANYLLPFAYIEDPNNAPYIGTPEDGTLKKSEVHFQISVKAPIREDVILDGDSFWAGYTMRAFWQAYNAENSRPFRETNHEPELIWETKSELNWLGFDNVFNQVSLNHQSNGRSESFSRSWNRVMFNSAWERKKMSLVASYWERLQEDPAKDENPGIETYIGNLQLMGSYAFTPEHRATLMLRGNPVKGKGAAELTWSFPLFGTKKIRGMAKLFDGYGETLLDYNVRTRSIGLGFMVTDWY
jgi:phospholipase A1